MLESLFVTEGSGQLGPIFRVGIGPKCRSEIRPKRQGRSGSVGSVGSVGAAALLQSERRYRLNQRYRSDRNVGVGRAERNGAAGFSQSDMLRGWSGLGRDRVGAQRRCR